MLHIILLILRIIGMILAVLVGVLVLALLVLLFVPIRYRIEAAYDEKPTARIRLSWLLHLVRAYAVYDQEFKVWAKVAMFTVYGGQEKKKKLDHQIKKENKKFEKTVKNVFEEEEEKVADENQVKMEEAGHHDEYAISEESAEHQTIDSDVANHKDSTDKATNGAAAPKKKKLSFFPWLKLTVKYLYRRVSNRILSVKRWIYKTYQSVVTSKNSIALKIQTLLEMIESEENRELVSFLWGQFKLLLTKIRPRKYRINLDIGMEDPYTTGQIGMYLSVVYGLLGVDMNVNLDFEKEVLCGNVYLKGYVRVFPVLLIAWRVYRNRLVKKIILKSNR